MSMTCSLLLSLRMTKYVTGVYGLSSIHFTVVLSVTSFFINPVLNYPVKSDTHFTNTLSPYTKRKFISLLSVMLVKIILMALPIGVTNVILNLMSHAACSQTCLLMLVMSTPSSSQAQLMLRSVVLAILKGQSFVVLNVNLPWILDMLRYHTP